VIVAQNPVTDKSKTESYSRLGCVFQKSICWIHGSGFYRPNACSVAKPTVLKMTQSWSFYNCRKNTNSIYKYNSTVITATGQL